MFYLPGERSAWTQMLTKPSGTFLVVSVTDPRPKDHRWVWRTVRTHGFHFQFLFLKTGLAWVFFFLPALSKFLSGPAAEGWVPNVQNSWIKWLRGSYLSCFLFKALVINLNCLFSDREKPESKILSFSSCSLPLHPLREIRKFFLSP
jgi:hypothetical protein